MARKSIPKPELDPKSFTPSITEGVERMWHKNGAAAIEFAEESDSKKVSVKFSVEIDLSKSEPVAEVGIRFSQAVTDSVTFTIDDPKQGKFTELFESKGSGKGEAQEPQDPEPNADGPKKKRGSKSKGE